MGAGKTCIGKRLARRLGVPFVDADGEIEKAAGTTITEIFGRHGEASFRDGERRVIARLLDGPAHVLATGGGAFMNEATRARIQACGLSIWLRADLALLLRRTARRSHRPLLNQGDRRATLEKLIAERHPVYGLADIVIDSVDGPPNITVNGIIDAIRSTMAARDADEGQAVTASR